MRGCVTLPFRLLLLALVVLGGVVAWSYRDEIRRRIHAWTADSGPGQLIGRSDASLLPAVRRKLESLGSSRRDTVLLTPSEVAHLIAAGAHARLPGAFDSIEVRLDRDDIDVRARVDTRRVLLSLGPLVGVLAAHERLEAGGRLVFRRAGLAEWQVTRVRVRGIPVPRQVLGRMLGLKGGDAAVFPVPLPLTVGGLRVSASGLVLYGLAPAGGAP